MSTGSIDHLDNFEGSDHPPGQSPRGWNRVLQRFVLVELWIVCLRYLKLD